MMVSKYWMMLKTQDGVRYDILGVINEPDQLAADCEAMEVFGKRLIAEARAVRRSKKAAA